MLGLKRVASFDEVLEKDKPFDLTTKIKNYNRAALDFRNSFFNQPAEEEVVDTSFDAQREQVEATMFAAGRAQEARNEQNRQQARQVFAENLSNDQPAHHHIPAESFADRMKERQEMFKQQGHWTYRRDMNRLRQEARQASERQQELNKRREAPRQPQQFNIASPQPSPPPSPRGAPDRLQRTYDERLLAARRMRNPTVARPKTTPAPNERLEAARQSATQIARKRERPPRGETRRTRRRTTFGPMV